MKLKEIMATGLIKTSVKSTVYEAAKIMSKSNIGSLLIEEDNKVIGIITERDILKKIVAEGKNPQITLVKEIMSAPLITMDSEKSVEEANELMAEKRIRRLLVESNGKIIGIVTTRDILSNLRYSIGRRIIGDNQPDYYKPSYGKDL